MHTIVMWMGGILAACGILFFAMTLVLASQAPRGPEAVIYAMIVGFGFIASGALLYCFGAIVQHLIAIRAATERQAAVLDRLGAPRS